MNTSTNLTNLANEFAEAKEASLLIKGLNEKFEKKSDVLQELRRNMVELENLQSRMKFMMGEITTLVRRH